MEQLIGILTDAIGKSGPIAIALVLLVLAVWAFVSGRVRVGPLVDAEKKEDRDALLEWKTLAQSTTPELKRLNDLLDTAVKLLLDPNRRGPPL